MIRERENIKTQENAHAVGRLVIEPSRDIARVWAEQFVAVGRHRRLVAEGIVCVAHGVCGAALVNNAAEEIIFKDGHVTEWIGYGRDISELVVSEGRAVPKRVNRSGNLADGVVLCVADVAATVRPRDAASKEIVGVRVGDTGKRNFLHGFAILS